MNKYSIILPVRNGGEYIKQCINSILAQTLSDFNLIILENCSTDGTIEWVKSLNDQRIRLIPSENPLSIEDNWGRITSIEKNEFMTMIGADDFLLPNYLEVIDSLIKSYPNASLYQTHFNFINEKGNIIRGCAPMKEIETLKDFLHSICYNQISIIGTGYMMRSKDYNSVGGIPRYPNLLFADFELWLELTRINFKVTAFQNCFSYRIHTKSTTASTAYKNYAKGLDMLMIYFKSLQENDKSISNLRFDNWFTFFNYYCKGSVHKLLRTPVKKRDGISVNDVINKYVEYSKLLIPGKKYKPTDVFSILLAKIIDSNIISRYLFLGFKKVYSKPIYNE